jgi:hypothetical protein
MSEHDQSNENSTAAAVWVRFMAAALAASPHAPIDKLGTTADDALAEYQRRVAAGRFDSRGGEEPASAGGATAAPFESHIEGGKVTYEPTAAAPDDDDIDSPFRPPAE